MQSLIPVGTAASLLLSQAAKGSQEQTISSTDSSAEAAQ